MDDSKSFFERLPQFARLRRRVPDDVIIREVTAKEIEFAKYVGLAEMHIKSVLLAEVFPPEIERERIILQNFLGQWGNISIEELCKICLIVAWLKPKRIFEFGTYNGMTTLQIAMNAPADCELSTLDVRPNSAEAAALEVGEIDRRLALKVDGFAINVGSYFGGTPYADRIRQLWGDSTLFDFEPYAHSMDLVFVDAGHTYPYVKSDTENALRILRPGGVVIWHDYLQLLHPGVTKLLSERAAIGLPIFHLRGTNLAVHRRLPEQPR